jgi:hypothetical protein
VRRVRGALARIMPALYVMDEQRAHVPVALPRGIAPAREHYACLWCACEVADAFGSAAIYHDNGCMPWGCCVYKQHWHCGACRKLAQVG